jgi:hypothetical protein
MGLEIFNLQQNENMITGIDFLVNRQRGDPDM